MSKYEVFSGPYFPAFGLNTDQKKNSYLDTFHTVPVNQRRWQLLYANVYNTVVQHNKNIQIKWSYSSLPIPDCLKPPNGAWGTTTLKQFTLRYIKRAKMFEYLEYIISDIQLDDE